MLAIVIGKRDDYHARALMEDLGARIVNHPQISTDALTTYVDAVERGFGSNADYGQISKTFSLVNLNKDAASRYSPCDVVRVDKAVISGNPDPRMISRSHVEKENHTLRMHCRRLTNAFSKKLENFKAAIALNFAYYNFVKTHGAIRNTPAMAAGVEKSAWSMAGLVERCGE